MINFQTSVVSGEPDVASRLSDFGLVPEQFMAIGKAARIWADDASPLMPLNAPGTLAYIYGVMELRQQFLDGTWVVDRTCGVEAIINRELNLRIAFQNVDRACDEEFPPTPRSAKGSAAENLCGPTLFEHAGVETGPVTGVLADGVPTYYVMIGEDGSIEFSHPVIKNGSFKHFHERVFIFAPSDEWDEEIDTETGPIEDFDIAVEFKSQL